MSNVQLVGIQGLRTILSTLTGQGKTFIDKYKDDLKYGGAKPRKPELPSVLVEVLNKIVQGDLSAATYFKGVQGLDNDIRDMTNCPIKRQLGADAILQARHLLELYGSKI